MIPNQQNQQNQDNIFNKPSETIADANASIKNIKENVKESMANQFKSMLNNSNTKPLIEPIRDSINAVENASGMAMIPIMIGLGVLIIALIIIVVFKEQVSLALNIAWAYIKSIFEPKSSTPSTPEPSKAKLPNIDATNTLPTMDMSAIQQQLPGTKEVFNIAVNKYKYTDAEPLCKAYGAELATYEQVKEAWKSGADWCNYGWIKGQSAVFPTQEATYNKLQSGPEENRMSCGVPGVNGGYFDNPDLKFGVNCYGSKPSENDTDIRFRQSESNRTPAVIEYDKKVADYKNHKSEIPLNPFQPGKWF